MDCFIGTIFAFGFTYAPAGFAFCDGKTVPVNQYQALLALIGTYYGGDGKTTIGLPNLQGRVPLGFGKSNSGVNYQIAQKDGQETTQLTLSNLPVHTHAATFNPTLGTQSVTIPATTGDLSVTVNATTNAAASETPSSANNQLAKVMLPSAKIYAPAGGTQVPLGGVAVTGTAGTPQTKVDVTTITGGSVTVGNTGSGAAFSNMTPYLALNFSIALLGLWPSRD